MTLAPFQHLRLMHQPNPQRKQEEEITANHGTQIGIHLHVIKTMPHCGIINGMTQRKNVAIRSSSYLQERISRRGIDEE